MKAEKAKELTTAARQVDMTSVYRRIECAAKNGHDSLRVETGSWSTTNSVDNVMANLRANGYKVKREQGSDQRDGDSWDYIIISW